MSYVFTGVAVGVHEDFDYNVSAITMRVVAENRTQAEAKALETLGKHPDCTDDQCTERSWKFQWKRIEAYHVVKMAEQKKF